ncbi:MAG: VOC family protein [Sphingobium sp.]|nr:VOC family protein [Sphingobium sp.]
MDCKIGYVIVGVKALEPAVAFYRDVMGFKLLFVEPQFHFASFRVGDMDFSLASGEGGAAVQETHGTGDRNTGIGFVVDDLDRTHADLAAKGVYFTMAPSKQPWGGYMAMFSDPDGNIFYLNQAGA